MTLFQIIKHINDIADQQPNINTIVRSGNIFDLNSLGDVEYSSFCITQQPHIDNNGWREYNFYLFVVDRLLADKSNKVQIQSAAIETLENIISTLRGDDELEVSENITFHTFTQRFSSECAGAYCLITISTPIITDCSEDYE